MLCHTSKLSLQYGIDQFPEKYLNNINITQLKQKWRAIELYKIRKVFQSYARKDAQSNRTVIACESLKEVFSEFYRYQDRQVERIYEIFDFENKGCLEWTNFYAAVTVCYKAPVQTICLLMFMIFDQSLAQRLNQDQLSVLVQANAHFIRQSSVDYEVYFYDPQDIPGMLIAQSEQFVSVQKWQKQAGKIFDLEQYRKFFNIFVEVKLEKQLIQNFQAWNQVYSEEELKYVSYIVDFKWFQLWKAYVLADYGVKVNSGAKNPNTLKTLRSIKTKRTFKTINSIKTDPKIVTKVLIGSPEQESLKNTDQKSKIKNYNLINGHIGAKPLRMFNRHLEGQFLQVLAPELVENMNYVLVSEKVWNRLKFIYYGYPEFRRTGTNSIQLYPKRVKIYSSLFKEKIDYSSEIIREVPCCTKVQEVLKESLQIDDLSTKTVFFKTIGMSKWQELNDLSFMFTELTAEMLIFLAYFDPNQAIVFKRNHSRVAQCIAEVNLGDQIRYDHSQKSQLKRAIYMGQTQNGKQIIHFKGISHIYDQYVQRQKFMEKTAIVHRNSMSAEQIKIYPLDIPLIPIVKSFGFVNSLVLMLLSNLDFKNILTQVPYSQRKQVLDFMSNLYKNSKKKSRVDASFIVDLVEINLSEYLNFQFSMIDDCYRSLMQILDKNLRKTQFKNVIRQQYHFSVTKKVKCLHCSDLNTYTQKTYSLNIQLPQNPQKYLQFTYVPFSSTLKTLDVKKYGLKMKNTSTYRQYKAQIGRLIECEGSQMFVICQVYDNDIIRNFSQIKQDTTLQELSIRETDVIFVYELCQYLGNFVADHYTQVKDITQRKLKIGDFIDCKVEQKWLPGKIASIQFMPYTQKIMIKAQHKSLSSTPCHLPTYQLTNQTTSIFPTKSYLYSQQYHLKVLQRCYNQALNQMLPSNVPFVMVLTDWMRCKELQFMVYQQMKVFIAENYRFKDVQQYAADKISGLSTHRHKFLSYKQSKYERIKMFREYTTSETFPYTISILDLNGRCLVCHKIHKTCIYKGQSAYYCAGCRIDSQNPIAWQLKINNCMVCIDWQGLDRFKKNIIKDHKSLTDMIMNKKNDIQRLQKLIQQKLSRKVEIMQQLCCNYPYKTLFHEQMKSYPQVLVIQIQRLIDNNGLSKNLNLKHVNFPFTDLKVGKLKTYYLTGVIGIQGVNNVAYKNYICNGSQDWFEVHGEVVKKVKKNIVQKCCALFLVYKLQFKQGNSQDKLYDCRQEDEFGGLQTDSAILQVSARKNNKQLTINQKLQNMELDFQNFSYLNTEQQDQINQQLQQNSQSDSDIPPQRSNSKRQVKYIKDSKQLIKSISQCGRTSFGEKQNFHAIHPQGSKQGKRVRPSNTSWSFEDQGRKGQKIKFEFDRLERVPQLQATFQQQFKFKPQTNSRTSVIKDILSQSSDSDGHIARFESFSFPKKQKEKPKEYSSKHIPNAVNYQQSRKSISVSDLPQDGHEFQSLRLISPGKISKKQI